MLRNQLYYGLKPFIPARLRLAMRRWHAQRLRRKVGDVWPINEAAACKPDGWPGWPAGKQFAVVLTHDVEGPEGLAKVRQLAELEMKHGFRSSFNFIPEGTYTVPPELRSWLVENGFEVGVHDLYHDGKLYRSREKFRQQAQKINRYLKEWNAVGFRSGFMHHNLEWIHDLDIAYDMSTFDTDPFEPQPDGVGTIFPFWVPRPLSTGFAETATPESVKAELATPESVKAGTPRPSPLDPRPPSPGYLELPYTLPQDSTLFLFLQEQGIDIWTRKTEWIAQNGGMVLVNVHPDYWQFDFNAANVSNGWPLIPISHYESFLQYLRQRFANQFWHGTPSKLLAQPEIANYLECAAKTPLQNQMPSTTTPDYSSPPVKSGSKPKRACLIGALFYESDNRTIRYAEALREAGYEVDVIAIRHPDQAWQTVINGIHVYRIQSRTRNEKGKFSYLWRLLAFVIKGFFFLGWMHLKRRYQLIHAHSIPDFVVFSAAIPKLFGAKILLDIYDVTPEFYLSKFKAEKTSLAYRSLVIVERICCGFADHVISANHLWQKLLTSRSVKPSKCTPFINYVDTNLFHRRQRQRADDRIIVVYPGILNWHQGVDIAIRAFRLFKDQVPKAEFHIYGDGNEKPRLLQLIQELNLHDSVFIKGIVPLAEVPQIMADADLGVVAKRNDVFGGEAYSTKIMEYMTQGIPVVIAKTNIDAYYFDESVVCFFEPENFRDMADKMLSAITQRIESARRVENAFRYIQDNSWLSKKDDYLQLAG